jgi:hypothetical protein
MPHRPVSVIEFPGYRRRADELLTPEEQDAIVDLVAYEPARGDLIMGTGGLRKLRIGREAAANEAAQGSSTISATPNILSCCWRFTRKTKRPI